MAQLVHRALMTRRVGFTPLDPKPEARRGSPPTRQSTSVNPLPPGALPIGVGLGILGITVYSFLTVSARALGPDRYSALSALWALVFLVGPGLFYPVEQEVSRAVAARISAGLGVGPVVRSGAAAAASLAGGLALVAVVLSGPLVKEVFDGQFLVLVGFLASLVGYAAIHVTRGVLSGGGQFGAYAVLLGAEGTLRLIAAAALLALGVRTAGPLALAVGLTPVLAVVLATRYQRGVVTPGPPVPWSELFRSLGLLLLASLLVQVLIHAGPLAVKLLAAEDTKELTARFFAGVLVTRIPLFLFFAVQAVLLPGLTTFAVEGDRSGFCRALNRLLAIVGVVGLTFVGLAFTIGRQAVTVLFGSKFVLDGRGMALLAASTAAIMIAQVLAQALVALEGQGATAACWLAGVATFVIVTAVGNDPLLRVELGLVTGSVVAAVAMAGALVPRLERLTAASVR